MTSMNYFDADWKNFNDFFKRKKVMGNASNNKIQQSSSSSILYTVTVLLVYITMRLNIGNRNKKFVL
jgi:hypothetical protein